MTYTSSYVVRPRRFIQYNDLVFEGTESINSTPSETITTKYASKEYLMKHGSYVKTSSDQLLIKEDRITLDLAIRTTDWDMEKILAHQDFIKEQLITRGKLWAIDTGGQLIWADCLLDSYTPTYEWTWRDDGYILFQVEFNNPSGVWHKASGYTTWLVPYDTCSFTAMIANCFENNTCQSYCKDSNVINGTCEDCNMHCCELKDAIPLCEMGDSLITDFYVKCNSKWRVVHNCQLGREVHGDERLWGQTFCDMCLDGSWSGTFYSDTVLYSKDITVILQGKFTDPSIMINDTKVKLNGVYHEGFLSISSDGKVLAFETPFDLMCDKATQVSNKNITLCDHKWWSIHKGYNQVYVTGIDSESFCIFIDYERITF